MISNAEGFRALVHGTAQNEPNPHIVAEQVVDKLDGDAVALAIALRVCAPAWMATFLKRPRLNANPPLDDTVAPEPVRLFTDAEGNTRASVKTVGLVDWYDAKLNASVKAGEDTMAWKRLGDCTLNDLRWMVTERRRQAETVIKAAETYERLADELERAGAENVRALGRAVVEPILKT